VERRLRVAVVGTGFGARIHVPGLRSAGCEVTALVGRDAARTRHVAERLGVPSAHTALADALDTVDAVAIATPPGTHAALAVEAARAGKHVLCEKPMATTSAEATAMCEAVDTAGVVALIDFEFRFHPSHAGLARMVARGDLGVPQLLVAIDALPLYVAPYKTPPAWWYDADAGGGWLGASGSHLVDATRTWLGEIAALTAMVDTLGAGSADDTFAMLLRTASGARAVLEQSAAVLGPRAQLLRLSGSEGTAWIDEAWDLWRAGRAGEPARVPVEADLALPAGDVPPGSGPFASRELPSFARMATAFRDAVRGVPVGAVAPATFADGLACQRILDAAREASRTRRWLRLA
jgi:predicted dehydrogenase